MVHILTSSTSHHVYSRKWWRDYGGGRLGRVPGENAPWKGAGPYQTLGTALGSDPPLADTTEASVCGSLPAHATVLKHRCFRASRHGKATFFSHTHCGLWDHNLCQWHAGWVSQQPRMEWAKQTQTWSIPLVFPLYFQGTASEGLIQRRQWNISRLETNRRPIQSAVCARGSVRRGAQRKVRKRKKN